MNRDYRQDILSNIYSLIKDSIVIDGEAIEVGTAKPQSFEYINYFIDRDEDISTDDNEIRDLTIAFSCVSIQSMNLADDSRVDQMVDQLKQILLYENSYSFSTWTLNLVQDSGTENEINEIDSYSVIARIFNLKMIISK